MPKKIFIGVDVGGTKIAGGLVTVSGKVIAREKQSTPPQAKPKKIYNVLADIIDDLLQKNKTKLDNIYGIGVGIPGLVDPNNRILITPNINLSHYPLALKLKKKFKVKVFLGNDVNLGLLAEYWLGVAKNFHYIVGLFPGTGIGGGVILHGELFTGPHGAAAELGHMIMDREGPPCSCGNRGCLEALASRWAIERDIRQAIKNGQKSIITKLTNGHLNVIKSKVLKQALKHKDPLVTRIMQNAASVLGEACLSLRHIFNPELIVLGGGVMEACGNFILPIVRKTMEGDPFFAKFDNCRVVQSLLKDDAVILGAVALVKNNLRSQRN